MNHTRKRAVAATVGLLVSGLVVVSVAVASLPFKFSATNLVGEAEMPNPVHVNSDRVKFQTKDPVDVRVQEVNIEPGGFSGWHHHPGIVIVAVKEGAITFVDGADCRATTYGPDSPNGSVFVESGDTPGEARNLSTDQPAKAYATFVAPDRDNPPVFRIEDAPVSCP